jgi:spermidine synthase
MFLAFVCFLFSGISGLIYEVVWTRMLTQIFGNTTHAIATVLSSFMAGLALGSYAFGRWVREAGNSLRLYGLLEAGIGVYGMAIPWLFGLAQGLYSPLQGLRDFSLTLFTVVLFAFCFFLLLVPTSLMGATLPVLSRFFVRQMAALGRSVGNLYGINTLGAVVGCAGAGYFLIPFLGMRATVQIAAAVNLVVAVVIVLVGFLRLDRIQFAGEAPSRASAEGERIPWTGVILLLGVGASGYASMLYENAWSRALTLVIGSSTYAFTTMLTTFLIGLATGSFLYARLWGARRVTLAGFGLLQFAVGLASLATIPLFESLPLFFIRLHKGFGDTFGLLLSIQLVISSFVMLVPTLLLGITFPMVAQLFIHKPSQVGRGVGTSYASNTLGAIVGAAMGGFVLIPWIGVQQTIHMGVVINIAIGLLLTAVDLRRGWALRLVGALAVATVLVIENRSLPTWDRHILTSGVTIYVDRYDGLPASIWREALKRDEILYYREGTTATISVHKRLFEDFRFLKTNGKVDAGYGDHFTQLMAGYLPMLFHPEARHVLVIGLGSGVTAKAVGTFPLKRLDIVEIEPAVVEGARFFAERNGKILEDARVRVFHADGRNHVFASTKKYDVIISEPSNPWIAGVANLYTQEFYKVAREKLAPGGVFGQWVQYYTLSPDDLRMVVRTFAEAFPDVTLWGSMSGDLIMVGTTNTQRLDYHQLKSLFDRNQLLRNDLLDLGLSDPMALISLYRMGKKELLEFSKGAEINTDDLATLEFSAPKSLAKQTTSLNGKIMKPFFVQPRVEGMNPHTIPKAKLSYYRSQGYKNSGREAEALEQIQKAIEFEPDSDRYRLLYARLLIDDENTEKASEEMKKIRLQDPSLADKLMELAESLEPAEALPVYRKILQARPGTLKAKIGIGNAQLLREDTKEAEAWFRRAKEDHPDHPKVSLSFGLLALVRSDFKGALPWLEKARFQGEESAVLYGALGQSFEGLHRYKEAISAFQKGLRFDRKNLDWRIGLARSLEKLGQLDRAEEEFRKILDLRPGSEKAYEGLRRLGEKY